MICAPESRVREVQRRLIESPTGLLVLRDEATGTPVGIVTWHDLLGAEMVLSEGQTPLRI